MFCPQCSNEILSERARFCTRCGFPLATVKELVETEVAKSKAEEEKKKYPLRQIDISPIAGLMTIVLIALIAILVMSDFGGRSREHRLLLLAIVGIFVIISLLWARLSGAFTRLFFDKELTHKSQNHAPLQPVFKAANTAQPLLPQTQSSAVVEINPQETKTKEPVQPFSVTEDSTSLLNKG